MAQCENCGNNYDKTFTVTTHTGAQHVFDSYECAIHMLAPTCPHCGTRIIGHGVEANGQIFCCGHCAEQQGVTQIVDRVD